MQTLGLIIAAHGVKPAVAMKTLSRTFRFVVLGVIVIVAVVSCCCFSNHPRHSIALYSVEIGNTQRGQYVEWKTKADFDNALAQVRGHNGDVLTSVFLMTAPIINRIHPKLQDCHS